LRREEKRGVFMHLLEELKRGGTTGFPTSGIPERRCIQETGVTRN